MATLLVKYLLNLKCYYNALALSGNSWVQIGVKNAPG